MNYQELRKEMMIVVNSLRKLQSTRELSLAITNAQEAQMFAGEFLKVSGLGDNPYAKHDGKRQTVEDIEPLFDATDTTLVEGIFEQGNIKVIDTLREILARKSSEVLVDYTQLFPNYLSEDFDPTKPVELGTTLTNLRTSMIKTRMWLGMEFGRIRDTTK